MTNAPTPDLLLPGSLVGPWRIERWVGRGTYGVVFQATRAGHPLSEPVALKIAIFADDPRFDREAELLSRIRHPAVPALVDRGGWTASDGQNHPYLVMEWVEGLSLYEWARVHNPTARQVLHVVAHVAWALEAMHEDECLHRDVKGDNIRVRADGRAFLMDFGSGTWAGAPRLTDGPMPPGTREYRCPEALRFQWYYRRSRTEHYAATPADDVYALGVVAYRAVTGAYPPPGTDPEARLAPIRAPPPGRVPPQAVNARVVPELAALIEQMVAEVSQARPSAREVALAAQVAAELGGPEADLPLSPSKTKGKDAAAENKRPRPSSAPVQNRRPLLIPAAMCLLLGMWGISYCPSMGAPQVTSVRVQGADKADAGTSGLGVAASTISLNSFEAQAPNVLGEEMPRRPFPGQVRSDANGKCPNKVHFVINGGCWLSMGNLKPPCGNEGYDWKGECYSPVLDTSRKPTSEER
jgi:serine/threonine protein kinase